MFSLNFRDNFSDSSVDISTNVDHPDGSGVEQSLHTPFTSDLGLSSNRSSIISQVSFKITLEYTTKSGKKHGCCPHN